MSIHTLPLVDILVLVPEYMGKSAIVDSAFELVRKLHSNPSFRYTLVSYPEDDPRFDIDYDLAYGRDKVVHILKHANGGDVYQPDLMKFEGGLGHAPFDYVDSNESFEARQLLVQRWLEKEAKEEWYEMDRPDYFFDPIRTLGILVNPYPHEQKITSGPSQVAKNVAFIQAANWEKELKEGAHLNLALELLASPIRFLIGHSKYEQLKHEIPQGCINDVPSSSLVLQELLRQGKLCPSCRKELEDSGYFGRVTHFLDSGLTILKELEAAIEAIQKKSIELTMYLDPLDLKIKFEAIGMSIQLSPKEFTLYKFLAENPKGLSKYTINEERDHLFTSYAGLRKVLTHSIFVRINTLLDGWQYSNDLRVTVAKINEKIHQLEHVPGMKRWMITRVGDHYRLHAGASY